jgi:hypothetical protein
MTVTSFWDELCSKSQHMHSMSRTPPKNKCCVVSRFLSAGPAILEWKTPWRKVGWYVTLGDIVTCFQTVALSAL